MISEIDIIHGDCLEVLREVQDNCIDSIVTDPPAGISFMGKEWDGDKGSKKQWIAWMQEIAIECLRVTKPGGHALVWALPRTSHWTATAWEDAGWNVRDRVSHLFGTGFPKSLDVSKAIDKSLGAEREVIGLQPYTNAKSEGRLCHVGEDMERIRLDITAPASPEAKQWDGWGTALKPACEDWWLLRKSLSEKTVAANVLRWGVGGLNIEASRVGAENRSFTSKGIRSGQNHFVGDQWDGDQGEKSVSGRYPSNVILDGSDEVMTTFPITSKAGNTKPQPASAGTSMFGIGEHAHNPKIVGDKGGSASRFFYHAKASKKDRAGSKHPTVKPIKLMEYLTRLVTPPNGTVLDPFAGTGTTGEACSNMGFNCLLIERELEYIQDIRRRLSSDDAEILSAQEENTCKIQQSF